VDLAETTPDLRAATLDTDLLEVLAHLEEALAHQAEAAELAMARQLAYRPDTDPLPTQNLLQPVALAIKVHLDPQGPKDHLETQARMETMARTEKTARTLNCWLPNPPKFALSAHKAHKVHQAHQELKARQVQRDLLVSHRVTEFQVNKAWPEPPDNKAAQDAKAHVELQDSQAVSFPYQDHKAQLDHQDNLENPDRRVNQAQMVSHSKDHQDCQEIQDRPAARDAQDLRAQPDLLVTRERRALASTAHLRVPHLAIKPPATEAFTAPLRLDLNWPLFALLPLLSVYIVQPKISAFLSHLTSRSPNR